jgi:hypothetical protein
MILDPIYSFIFHLQKNETTTMQYDIITAIDYSGSASVSAQKKHIYMVTIRIKNAGVEIISNITRHECREQIQLLLQQAHGDRKYCLIGFDFSLWFPSGFFQRLYQQHRKSWREQLRILTKGTKKIPPPGNSPREWAAQINEIFKQKYHVTGGPFWGPGFFQRIKPAFPFDSNGFSSRRLVEERYPKMKSIFQIGGIGSVGLQALFGISQIEKLLAFCDNKNIPLQVWPFDGWDMLPETNLICEIYPALYNKGLKGDREDALASAQWFAGNRKVNTLAEQFRPQLNATERRRAQTEGWVPGVL